MRILRLPYPDLDRNQLYGRRCYILSPKYRIVSYYTAKMKPQSGHGNVSILDIREEELSFSLLDDIHQMLRPGEGGEKRMPTMLLYDAKGLQLFEDITYLEEYYLTNAEIEVLENHSGEIAKLVPAGSLLLELGSGYVLALVSLREEIQPQSFSEHNYYG